MSAPGSLLARARPLHAARLASTLLGVALPMVVARVLAPAEYGTYRAALLVASSLQLVLPMGVSISLFYFVPREPRASGRWVAGALAWTWAAGLVAAALLLAGSDLLARHFANPALARQLPWVALSTLFTLGGCALDLALAASGALGAAGLVRAGTELGRAAAMIAGTLWLGSLTGALCGLAFAAGLRAALAWVWLSRRFPLELSGAALRRQLAYALPFGAAALAATAQAQLHLYAVGGAVTAAAFAVYAVGCFQLPIVDVLYTPVSEVLQIGLAELERSGRPGRGLALFREAVARLALALLPMVALLLAVAPTFIAFLFSERYREAAPLFRISLLAVPLAALPLDGVLRATAQNRFMLGVSLAKLAATGVLVLAGFRAFGPAGALSGWILAEAAARLAVLVRVGRILGAGARDVLPWGDLARQALSAAAAAPLAWLAVHAVAGPRLVRLAAAGTAYAAGYLGLLALLGGLDPVLPGSWRRAALPRRGRPAGQRAVARTVATSPPA